MRNAAERKDIRRAEKVSAELDRRRIEYVCFAMSTTSGRAWFYNLLSQCSIFDGSFSGDPYIEAFVKGQRNIGLLIYNDIVANCPDQFVVMMKEASILEQVDERRSQPELDLGDEFEGGEDGNR